MKFGDIITCPSCGKVINGDLAVIKRDNIMNDDCDTDVTNTKICRDVDNLFVQAKCPSCGKLVHAMITVEVKPIKCYTAENRSTLVMLEKEK